MRSFAVSSTGDVLAMSSTAAKIFREASASQSCDESEVGRIDVIPFDNGMSQGVKMTALQTNVCLRPANDSSSRCKQRPSAP